MSCSLPSSRPALAGRNSEREHEPRSENIEGVNDTIAKVLVAGGAGMAGSAIVEALLRRCPEGRVRATYRTTAPAIRDARVEHVQVDLLEKQSLIAALGGCDAAILAAAEGGGIGMLSDEPWRLVGANLAIASTWLEALHEAGVRRAVFVGSATCYQPFDGRICEDQLDLNLDPSPEAFGIGWVTRSAEKLCEFWGRCAGLDIVRVRAANIYGPRARFDPARSNFIPALVRKVVDGSLGSAGLRTLEVWGSPDVTRDVIYSGDFGEVVVRLLEMPAAAGNVFNVGSGHGVRVGDVVDTLLRICDKTATSVIYAADEPRSVHSRVLNCDRLYRKVGWVPPTSLEDGLRATVRWWQANRTTWSR